MKRISALLFVAVCLSLTLNFAPAAEPGPQAILDKGIKALGGEAKLSKVAAYSAKMKGTINFGGNESEFTSQTTMQGLDHVRNEFTGNFGGNEIKGTTTLNGDKGWRRFGDMTMELDPPSLANEKRGAYLQAVPVTLVPLKGKGFKLESADESKVEGKPAVGIKITGPDGKDFTMYFDKESGLPVRSVAVVNGFMGEEFTQETNFSGYKDFDGIKKATKVVSKRDGEAFLSQETLEFKVLDKVAPDTFAEPK